MIPHTAQRKTWRRILKEQGRTQIWLAAKTGVSFSTVYAYSNGSRPTSDEWLRRVADVLGVPFSLLTSGEEAA